jgi:hypothetical protein
VCVCVCVCVFGVGGGVNAKAPGQTSTELASLMPLSQETGPWGPQNSILMLLLVAGGHKLKIMLA